MSAIIVNSGSKKIKITDNVIQSAGTDGIRLNGASKTYILKNKISGYGGYGIRASKGQIKKEKGNIISGKKRKRRSWK